MNTHRWIALLVTCTILAVLGHATLQAQVPDPPLTPDMIDKDIDSWELVLDIRLTPAQRKQFERLRTDDWKLAKPAWKLEYQKNHQEIRVKNAKAGAAERGRIRDEHQRRTVTQVRGAPHDPISCFILSIYDAQVVAAGEPPLTRGDFDKMIDIIESCLEIRLTPPQRREAAELTPAVWKELTKAKREEFIKIYGEVHGRLAGFTRAQRAATRALGDFVDIEKWRKPSDKPEDKMAPWFVALYDAARKPGSDTNPILAKGEPPLTLDMINTYTDFLEWTYERTYMSGWPIDRLHTMQRLITADWTNKDAAGRNAFLDDLTWWKKTFPKLSDAERRAAVKNGRAYVGHVAKTTGEDKQRAQWIQAIVDDNAQEAKIAARVRADDRAVDAQIAAMRRQMSDDTHRALLNIYKQGSSLQYEYRWVPNPYTGRSEYRYVPK